MKRFVIAVVVVFVGLAALGVYQGWFQFATERTDHKMQLNITIDKDKFHGDTERARQESEDLGKEMKDEAKQGARTLGRTLQKAGGDEEAAHK
ncbi:MAG TPA: hypothetical protein VND64_06040 [Pirellulales bacterium]|nr:hypothetical protein [Pirellulales bacterium]